MSVYRDLGNHAGQNKLLFIIPSLYFSPNLRKKIVLYIKSCRTCQIAKHANRPPFRKLRPIPTPHNTFDFLSTDTVVLGNLAKNTRHKYIQVFIDHLSRFIWAFPTVNNTTDTIIKCIDKIIVSSSRKPLHIISDNFKSYTASKFKNYLHKNNIEHTYTTAYMPTSNGLVKKANHTITSALRFLCIENPNLKWPTLLPTAVARYNDNVHDSTKFSPFLVMYGKDDSPIPTNLTHQQILAMARHNSELLRTREARP